MKTKWGNAQLYDDGYYIITSGKEGNCNKRLHRLIWEDFYDCKVPKGYVIHHQDGNKTNNCILNLQLMSEKNHRSLHMGGENHPMYGKHHSIKSSIKRSKFDNTSGYFRVYKRKDNHCKQGFIWVYRCFVNSKQIQITSTDIYKLEEKVLNKGLEWIEFDKGVVNG